MNCSGLFAVRKALDLFAGFTTQKYSRGSSAGQTTQMPQVPHTNRLMSVTHVLFSVHKHHASCVRKWTAENMKDWIPPSKPTPASETPKVQFPLSQKTIPSVIPNHVREQLAGELATNTSREYHPEVHLRPNKCECNDEWKDEDEFFCRGTYYAIAFKQSVCVYYRRCVQDICHHHYDGQEDGVFNYSGETMVSYALLHLYVSSCLSSATTWNAFQVSQNTLYNKVFCPIEQQMNFMSLPTLIQVKVQVHTVADSLTPKNTR